MFGSYIAEINRFLSCSYVAEADRWSPYTGPRGGKGWKNSTTGIVAYQAESPGKVGIRAASVKRRHDEMQSRLPPASSPTPKNPPVPDVSTAKQPLNPAQRKPVTPPAKDDHPVVAASTAKKNVDLPSSVMPQKFMSLVKDQINKGRIKNGDDLRNSIGDIKGVPTKDTFNFVQFHGTQDVGALRDAIQGGKPLSGTGRFGEGFYLADFPGWAEKWSKVQAVKGERDRDIGVIDLDTSKLKIFVADPLEFGLSDYEDNAGLLRKLGVKGNVDDLNAKLKADGYDAIYWPHESVTVVFNTDKISEVDFDDIFNSADKHPEPESKPEVKTEVSGQKDWTWSPDINADDNGDGVADYSRVGVPANSTPPPPKIPRLPNLTEDERVQETAFADRFEADPDVIATQYRDAMAKGELGDGPNIFGTDDAKMLHGPYAKSNENRAVYNLALHQTANAIAKRAFVQHLEQVVAKMPAGARTILVTAGGVASGKGYSISKDPQMSKVATSVAAIWDSAGEQYSTELPWVLEQAQKVGASVTFLYVHADPNTNWMHPDPRRGVVNRAKSKGRMVDARLFAESYVYGAKNFEAFRLKNQATPGVRFAVIDNSAETKKLDSIPAQALTVDSEKLTASSLVKLEADKEVPPHIMHGGTIGKRVWRKKHA